MNQSFRLSPGYDRFDTAVVSDLDFLLRTLNTETTEKLTHLLRLGVLDSAPIVGETLTEAVDRRYEEVNRELSPQRTYDQAADFAEAHGRQLILADISGRTLVGGTLVWLEPTPAYDVKVGIVDSHNGGAMYRVSLPSDSDAVVGQSVMLSYNGLWFRTPEPEALTTIQQSDTFAESMGRSIVNAHPSAGSIEGRIAWVKESIHGQRIALLAPEENADTYQRFVVGRNESITLNDNVKLTANDNEFVFLDVVPKQGQRSTLRLIQ
jgi:hypothetical protein